MFQTSSVVKQFVAFTLFVLFTPYGFGQTSQFAITLEAGGLGGYGSLNIERNLDSLGKFGIIGRVGLSTYHLFDYQNRFNPDIIIPVSLHLGLGERHQFIGGIGASYCKLLEYHLAEKQPAADHSIHFYALIGYRIHPRRSKLFYSISATPIISFNHPIRLWGSLAFGYAF